MSQRPSPDDLFMTFGQVQDLLFLCRERGKNKLFRRYSLLRLGGDNGNSRYKLSHEETMSVLTEPVNITNIRRLKAACIPMIELVDASAALGKYNLSTKRTRQLLSDYVARRCQDGVRQDHAIEEMVDAIS